MRNDDRALSLADTVLRAAKGADQAQVSVTIADASYARFARNYVTQNLESQQTTVALTYYIGKKLGTVRSADVSPSGIARLVTQAKAVATRVPPDNSFVSLPKPGALDKAVPSFFASTADATADDRVDKLVPVFAAMKRSNLSCSGFTTTQTQTIAVANSLGVRVSYTGTSGRHPSEGDRAEDERLRGRLLAGTMRRSMRQRLPNAPHRKRRSRASPQISHPVANNRRARAERVPISAQSIVGGNRCAGRARR